MLQVHSEDGALWRGWLMSGVKCQPAVGTTQSRVNVLNHSLQCNAMKKIKSKVLRARLAENTDPNGAS